MSKTKLAIFIFALAFGVNILAFVFSKKTFLVEEVKNVWMYELPLSASPQDAYVSIDLGPHQGVVGTLFMPNVLVGEHPLVSLLADQWKWDEKSKTLLVKLKSGLTYSNGEAILPEHFVQAHEYLSRLAGSFASSAVWQAWSQAKYRATPDGLNIQLSQLGEDFDLEKFLSEVLTHPLSGVIHPSNLAELSRGEHPGKTWISSGPYKIRKWNPKEIEMVSREDFPVRMQKDFFRTLKFQSAPIKNPSCDFMQARPGDKKSLAEHLELPSVSQLSILWLCRSSEPGAFCQNPENRQKLNELLSGHSSLLPTSLQGQTVRYRIPTGSDDFRAAIRGQLEADVQKAGGKAEETSYFFKNSKDTDVELEFVFTPSSKNASALALQFGRLSSRLEPIARLEPNRVGLIASYPVSILMKTTRGDIFPKVFLEPDLDEKKLPL